MAASILESVMICGIVAAVFNRMAFFMAGHGGWKPRPYEAGLQPTMSFLPLT